MGRSSGMSFSVRTGWAVAAFGVMVAASSCVIVESSPPPRGVVVNSAPPPPPREPAPVRPSAQAVWVPGYWHWTGLEYTWIRGRWTQPPAAGATWHAPRYSIQGGQHTYEPGGWR